MLQSSLFAAAILAVQAPPTNPASPVPDPPITTLSQLPVEAAAAPRCGIVFAVVEGAQEAGNPEALQWPDMASSNGREFFVRAIAKLMDDQQLTRNNVAAIVNVEAQRLSSDFLKPAFELMEPCLLMKQAAGL